MFLSIDKPSESFHRLLRIEVAGLVALSQHLLVVLSGQNKHVSLPPCRDISLVVLLPYEW